MICPLSTSLACKRETESSFERLSADRKYTSRPARISEAEKSPRGFFASAASSAFARMNSVFHFLSLIDQ